MNGWPVLEDGHGNQWPKCSDRCDLILTFEGRAVCSGHCNTLEGWLTEPDPWADRLAWGG